MFHCTNDPVHGSSSLFFFTTDESLAVTIVTVFLTVLAFGIVCGVVFMLFFLFVLRLLKIKKQETNLNDSKPKSGIPDAAITQNILGNGTSEINRISAENGVHEQTHSKISMKVSSDLSSIMGSRKPQLGMRRTQSALLPVCNWKGNESNAVIIWNQKDTVNTGNRKTQKKHSHKKVS